MNMLPHRFGGFVAISLTAVLLVAPEIARAESENPLRRARQGSAATQSPATAVHPASHTSTSDVSPLRPTGYEGVTHQLASDHRSVITPRQEQFTETNIIGQELIEGDVIYEGDIIFEGGGKGAIVGGDCCGGSGCFQCFSIPCPTICIDNFEVFAGVHGFTGPVNRGETGSFGFHEGFNWGAPVPCFGALGTQIGLQATQSNLSGAEFTDETRHQLFLTGGLFRRVDWGLQGGLVFDYLSDDWYANTSLAQLRGELSWVFPCLHELGFWFSASTEEDTQLSTFSNGAAGFFSRTWIR